VFLAYKYIKIIFKKKKIYFNTNTSKRSENIKNNSNFLKTTFPFPNTSCILNAKLNHHPQLKKEKKRNKKKETPRVITKQLKTCFRI